MPNWLSGACWRRTSDTPETNDNPEQGEETEPIIVTDQPKKNCQSEQRDQDALFLCCARSKIREDQVDLCPPSWFRELTDEPETRAWAVNARRVLWRLCFISTCLPLCYPCYLSRTFRRRRKQVMFPMDDIIKKFDDDPNKTLQRQVTKKSGSHRSLLNSNVINANVILLHSPASKLLQRYLRSSYFPEAMEAPLLPTDCVSPSEVDDDPIACRHLIRRSNSYFAPNLTTVDEEDSKLLGDASVKITIDECDSEHPQLLRQTNGIRRKSSLAVRLSRLSRIRKPSLKRQTSQDQDREEEVTLRLSTDKSKAHLRRRSSRKLSVVSGSSIYYSFDSDEEDEQVPGLSTTDPSRSLEMETLGQRTELVKDLDCQVAFNMFDEASLADWRGRDLREAHRIPNFDILVVAVRKGNVQEIADVLNLHVGIMGYVAKFWMGFFPLLIIELLQGSIEQEHEDYGKKLSQLRGLYGDVLHVSIVEEELNDNLDWLHECMARLFLHARIYQCSRFFGADVIKTMQARCPGGCGLRKAKGQPKKMKRQKAALKKRRRSRLNSSPSLEP